MDIHADGLAVQEPKGTVRPLRKVLPAGISSSLFVGGQGRQSPLASVSLQVMNDIAPPCSGGHRYQTP